ncbi:MAG: MFS transporter, partial [Chloroflexota bacterium]|nr:MFS transporter [Chloroflexota bacterium]
MRPPRGGLWRHADFTRLWAAQSISAVGSQVSLLALPLIAVLTLEASPFAVGVLGFVGGLPVLLIGLIAGVWVDRLRRRPLMIAADLGRAILLLTIPIAWWQGALSMSLLCVVTLLTGLLSVLFDVSFLSYLPTLVSRDALVEGNSKLEASASSSQVVGPGLAGWLVGVAGAPVALVLDAASFLASALVLTRIQAPEPASRPATDRASLWTEMKDGLRLVRQSRILAALVACGATTSFSAWIFYAVYVLYMTRELGLTAEAVGLVFATGGAGALAGAMLAGPVRRRFGVGPTLVGGQLFFGLTGLFVPLALFLPSIALEIVVATEFLQWLGVIVYDINAVSLRQAITPRGAEGR